ncbi:MAG: ATP-binding protein [Bacillus sp. (in: firmicutes)]
MKMPILGGPNKGKVEEFRSRCICTDKPLAKEVKEDRIRKMQLRAIEHFDKFSIIPPDLEKATFLNYKRKNESMDFAFRLCYKYAQVFSKDEPRNILMYGSYGTGKSHLCVSIQKELLKKGISCIFIYFPDLLEKFRSTYNNKSELTEGDIMHAVKTVDLLVIDDVGAEGTTERFGRDKLSSIVNGRQGKHTICTSNFGPDEILDIFGERIFSRIMNQDTETAEVDGENHRLIKHLKKGE